MAKKILVHGSGHKAASWKETVSCMDGKEDLLCPDLCALLAGKTASYPSLYGAFAEYCDHVGRAVHLCGLSLGGILALNYALDFPEKVKTLVLIGTPHKIPKAAFGIQNLIFRFLPRSVFDTMAFDKESTFVFHEEAGFQGQSARYAVSRPHHLRGKGPFEYPLRPIPVAEHPWRGITAYRTYRPCCE